MRTRRQALASLRVMALGALLGALLGVGLIPVGATLSGATGVPSLVFITTPGTSTNGAPLATQPKVEIENGTGNATKSATPKITLVAETVGGHPATLSGCLRTPTKGVVSYSGCEIDSVGSFKLTASLAGFASATSKLFEVATPTATAVAFTSPLSTITAGNTFSPVPILKIEDSHGHVVTTTGIHVALAVTPKSDAGQGPLVCTGGEKQSNVTGLVVYGLTATKGVASFTGCTIDKSSSTSYHLVAAATVGTKKGLKVVSDTFTVKTGTPSQLVFSIDPNGALLGTAFEVQPVVAVEDAVGNVVSSASGTVSLTITPGTNTTSHAQLQGCSAGTLSNGLASFSGCSLNKVGTGYKLSASITLTGGVTLTATSRSFAVSSGPASVISFTTTFTNTPGAGTGGSPLSRQPTVSITDSTGDPVSGAVQLSLQKATGGSTTAKLTCVPNPTTAGTGTAKFTNCAVDKVGSYRLVAKDVAVTGGPQVVSKAFTVTTGPAAQVVFTTSPSSSTGGTPFPRQPVVSVEDLGGNPVPHSSVTLGIAPGTGTSGAALTCTGDPTDTATALDGTVGFTGCAIDRIGTGYKLTATSAGVVGTSPTSFTVALGPPAKLVFSAEPSGGTVSTPFGGQPQVTVTDAGGNPEPDPGISIGLSISSGALTCLANPTSTGAGGTAVFAGCKGSATGKVTLGASATGTGLAPAISTPFTVVAGTPLGLTPVGVPVGQTFGGSTLGANPSSIEDDVDGATGALSLGFNDLKVAAVGEPLTLTRQYNSNDTTGGAFGPGWSSILDAGVTVAANGKTAVARGVDGQQLVFSSNGSGGWTPPAGAHASLTCQGALCTVTQFDGTVFQSVGGQIQDYLSADGIGLHFIYSQGHLAQITGSARTLVEAVEASLGTSLGTQAWTSTHAGSANLDAIVALDATHLWAVGANCTAEFSADGGRTWSADPNVTGCPTGSNLTSVISDGTKGPAFAVGSQGSVLECASACNTASATWVRPSGTLPHPSADVNFTSAWSPGPTRVYAVGTTTGGAGEIWACVTNCAKPTLVQTWANITPAGLSSTALNAISGHGTTFLVVAGAGGTVLVCATSTCTKSPTGWAKLHAGTAGVVPPSTVTFGGVWVGGANRVIAVGSSTTVHGKSGAIWACSKNCLDAATGASGSAAAVWANVTPSTMGTTALMAVSGQGTADVWAVSHNGQLWYCPVNCTTAATGWVSVGAPGGSVNGLAGITSFGTVDAWAVGGNGTVVRSVAPTSEVTSLDKAVASLGAALTPASWKDGNDLTTGVGGQTLTQLVNAIGQLAPSSLSTAPAWEAVDLLDLEQALRIISANALSENISGPLHPTSLSTGEKQFSIGTTDMAAGLVPAAASAYKSAWTDAIAATGSGQGSHTPLQVTVRENVSGEVITVSTPTRSVHYGYTGNLLTSYTDADGNTWSYLYTTRMLSRVVDPTANTRLTVAYSGGRVVSASTLGSQTHSVDSYTWNPATQVSIRRSSVQLSEGAPTTTVRYLDEYSGNVLLAQQSPDGATTSYRYDANLDLTGIQEPLGQVQRMTFSPAGDLVSQSSPVESGTAVVSFTYNANHQMLSSTDADGNTTKYAYTGGNPVQTTPPGPASGATRYRFNYLGEQYEVDGPTSVKKFTFDSAGNETGYQIFDLEGNSLDGLGPLYAFNEGGQTVSSTDPRGHLTTGVNTAYETVNSYNDDGEQLSTTAPGAHPTTTTYRADGAVTSVTQPTGQTTTYSWNETTLQLSTSSPAGTTVSTFDPAGHLLAETTADGATTTYTYDTTGRKLSETDPTGVTTDYRYDLESNVLASSTSGGFSSTFTYDAANQLVGSTVNGLFTSTTYDPAGQTTSETDGDGRTSTFTYTSHELAASVTTSAGTTKYGYDLADNLTSVTDGNGHSITYTVNGAGERTKMTVGGNATTYTYDVAGNLVSSTDPDGRTTRYTLNPQDERTEIAYSQSGQPSIDIYQTFNAAGQRTSVTDPTTGTTTYRYDAGGNLIGATNNKGGGKYTYDYTTPGKMIETYPDGTQVTYNYDDAQALMGVSTNTGVDVSYVRNAERQVTGIAYSNGILQSQAYDEAGLVTSMSLTCGGTTELTHSTSFDAAGDPLGESTTAGTTTTTQSYGYDTSARVDAQLTATTAAEHALPDGGCTSGAGTRSSTAPVNGTTSTTDFTTPTNAGQPVVPSETSPGSGTTTTPITYDKVGDITSIHGTTIGYNATDEVTSESPGAAHATYTYDKNGDVTSKVTARLTTTYSYNAADQLVAVTRGGTKITYTYDGDGNRVSRTIGATVTDYSWDPSGPVPLLALICAGSCATPSDTVDRFIYGVGPVAMQTQTGTFYLHQDQNGDVIAVSNSKGKVVEAYSYDGLGNVTSRHIGTTPAPAEPLLFQGQFLDTATGLYDMRARNYDPTSGTFTQRDPVAPTIGTPVFSPYSYADDVAPVSADPTGDASEPAILAIEGHSTETADIAATVQTGFIVFYKVPVALSKAWTALKNAFAVAKTATKEASYAVEELDDAVEPIAGEASAAAGDFGAEVTAVTEEAGGGAGAEASSAGDIVKIFGGLLAVAGVGLSIYITVETCEHGSVARCVGDAVSTAISVGCLYLMAVETGGLGVGLCGMASVAIGLLIDKYGPEIAQALAPLWRYVSEGVTHAFDVVEAAFNKAGAALKGAYAVVAAAVSKGFAEAIAGLTNVYYSAVGAITTGFNKLDAYISSGFNSALSTLENAGESALALAETLKNEFGEDLHTALNELISLGYDVEGIAKAIEDAFADPSATVALILQGLKYTVTEIAKGLRYGLTLLGKEAASILKSLGITVDQIGAALKNVFDELATGVATILKGLEYSAKEIAGALHTAFTKLAEGTLVGFLQGLGYTIEDIATALSSVYTQGAALVAKVLASVGITLTQVATALRTFFKTTAATLVKIFTTTLKETLDSAVTSLENIYKETASLVTTLLKSLTIAITTISDVLESVFGLTFTAIVGTLQKFFATTVIDTIGGAFSKVGSFFTTTVGNFFTTTLGL